jgi:hypothetical protein
MTELERVARRILADVQACLEDEDADQQLVLEDIETQLRKVLR